MNIPCSFAITNATVTYQDVHIPTMMSYPSNLSSYIANSSCNETVAYPISDVFDKTHLIPVLVYVCFLFILGVPGNIFVCYIYYYKWTKKTSRVFILALAVFDLINNLVSLPTEIALLSYFYSFDYSIVCKVSRFVTFVMNSASSTVLVGIGWDRLMGICFWSRMRPMKIRTAKLISVLSVVFAVATGWPSLFIYGTSPVPGVPGSKTCLYDNNVPAKYKRIFAYYVLGSNLVYDTVLIILYFIIGRYIMKSSRYGSGSYNKPGPLRRPSALSNSSVCEDMYQAENLLIKNGTCKKGRFIWRSQSLNNKQYLGADNVNKKAKHNSCIALPLSGRSPTLTLSSGRRPSPFRQTFASSSGIYVSGRRYRTGKTTTTLFIVTLVFILSFVPYCVISIARLSHFNQLFSGSFYGKVFFHLFLRTYFLSSVLNPLIYNGFNAKFRAECKRLIKNLLCYICKCSCKA